MLFLFLFRFGFFVCFIFVVVVLEKGKLFGMGDNSENQLGMNQRNKSGETILRVNVPTRIQLSAHFRASKAIQLSCGASHTAAVTGQ